MQLSQAIFCSIPNNGDDQSVVFHFQNHVQAKSWDLRLLVEFFVSIFIKVLVTLQILRVGTLISFNSRLIPLSPQTQANHFRSNRDIEIDGNIAWRHDQIPSRRWKRCQSEYFFHIANLQLDRTLTGCLKTNRSFQCVTKGLELNGDSFVDGKIGDHFVFSYVWEYEIMMHFNKNLDNLRPICYQFRKRGWKTIRV